jgi:hypothetical protein
MKRNLYRTLIAAPSSLDTVLSSLSQTMPSLGRRKEESEMDSDLRGTYRTDHGPRGAWLRGETPKELVLSDGSRLRLEPAEDGRVEWRLSDELRDRNEALTVGAAERLAGDFAGYVGTRTRAEAEWLRAVSDWCTAEASRLELELSSAAASRARA